MFPSMWSRFLRFWEFGLLLDRRLALSSPIFKSLGLLFDVGSCHEGVFSLQHTEARKLELSETLDGLVNCGRLTPKDLERLHGRLIWFGAFVFGCTLNQLVKQISTCHWHSSGSHI